MSRAALLDAYLAEVQGRRFDWHSWNCCHFAAEWVRRASGLQPMAGLPATDNARAALRLRTRMGASLADAVTLQLGLAPFAAELAQVGDVVAVRDGTAQAVGICAGRTAAVLRVDGLAHVPMSAAVLAWRVGRC
jgi:hypothetical protein